MKSFLITTFSAFLIASCSTSKTSAPLAVGLVNLSNYTIKNSVPLPEEYNYMVFTNSEDFNSHFTPLATAGQGVDTPGFSGQTVVAISKKPTNKKNYYTI